MFRFKQFHVDDSGCGMKICSDSVLLGAWFLPSHSHAASVLDIGAGSGLLSLMAAQVCPEASVTGIEIDLFQTGFIVSPLIGTSLAGSDINGIKEINSCRSADRDNCFVRGGIHLILCKGILRRLTAIVILDIDIGIVGALPSTERSAQTSCSSASEILSSFGTR